MRRSNWFGFPLFRHKETWEEAAPIADATDDREIVGFVLSRRFLGRFFLRLLSGYIAQSVPQAGQHICKGEHFFHSLPTDILLSLEHRVCLMGLPPPYYIIPHKGGWDTLC